MDELITREQFDAEALAYANELNSLGVTTAKTLLTHPRMGYDKLPEHLKADLHRRLGVEPIQMFRRTAKEENHG